MRPIDDARDGLQCTVWYQKALESITVPEAGLCETSRIIPAGTAGLMQSVSIGVRQPDELIKLKPRVTRSAGVPVPSVCRLGTVHGRLDGPGGGGAVIGGGVNVSTYSPGAGAIHVAAGAVGGGASVVGGDVTVGATVVVVSTISVVVVEADASVPESVEAITTAPPTDPNPSTSTMAATA